VTAFSSDLKDESLDGQRVVIGGIVTGFRRIITKANATMGVATLEDLQGTIEVVVFPKMYEQTAATWTEGTILLVAGRIDHRGDDVSLLADLALDWDSAVSRGAEAFAREVAAGDRGRGGRRGGPPIGGNGNAWPGGRGAAAGGPIERGEPVPVMAGEVLSGGDREPVAVGPGATAAATTFADAAPWRAPDAAFDPALRAASSPAQTDEIRPGVPRVSPLRADAQAGGELPRIAPAEPIPTYSEPADLASTSGPASAEADDEPALPDEARTKAALASQAPTPQVESQSDQVLHVRFGGATSDRLVLAMETFKTLLRERPGATRVVLHVPAPSGGGSLPMELSRRVAYDAELLSEVRRRLGDGLVDLSLA